MFLGGGGTPAADYPNYTGPNVTNFPKKFEASVKQAFDYTYVQGWFIQLEKDANGMAKTLANGIQAYQQSINEALFDAHRNTIEIGGSMQDVMGYITNYAQALGKIPNISTKATSEAVAYAKAVGVGATEVAQMVAKFSEVGIGQTQALERMKKIYFTAKKFGVDASTLTKTVTDNIKMASSYGFKGGVEGLTKMAARAQQLGIDFKLLNGVIEKALDPDTAIQMASEMQMLGGNVGALGDPFQLLYMAQNDIGKLQDEFINVTSAAVDFNETTGEFKVPVQEMYRLREMASKLGLNYDQIADAAVKAAKQKEVLSRITLPSTVSEEDKNLIASLAEINNGKVQITMPGTKELVDVANLSQAQIDMFKEQSVADSMSMEDIAKRQLSTSEKAEIALNRIEQVLINQYRDTGLDKNILTNLGKETTATDSARVNVLTSTKLAEAATKFEEAMTTVVTSFSSYLTNPTGFEADVDAIIAALTTSGGFYRPTSMSAAPVSDIYIPSSGNKPVIMSKGQAFEGIPEDETLMAPNISEFLNSSNKAFNTLSSLNNNPNMGLFEMVAKNMSIPAKPTENLGISISDLFEKTKAQPTITKQSPEINFEDILAKSMNRLNEFQNQTIQQNITTSQKVEGNVGVDGKVDINVNVPNGLLSTALSGDREFQQSLRDEIMNVVNHRLSKAYSQTQGNLM